RATAALLNGGFLGGNCNTQIPDFIATGTEHKVGLIFKGSFGLRQAFLLRTLKLDSVPVPRELIESI
ncbi:hypothetical protein KL942_005425, partial [Ogataea angusta]